MVVVASFFIFVFFVSFHLFLFCFRSFCFVFCFLGVFLPFVFSGFAFVFKWICFLLLYLLICVFFFSVGVSFCCMFFFIYTGIGSIQSIYFILFYYYFVSFRLTTVVMITQILCKMVSKLFIRL